MVKNKSKSFTFFSYGYGFCRLNLMFTRSKSIDASMKD